MNNMLIFAIDDEPKALSLLHRAISEAAPQAQIMDFSRGTGALQAIREDHIKPQIIFSDIRMPGLDGLDLAVQLKEVLPDVKIVFVTGYDEYALKAFRVHAGGYVLKPVKPDAVKKELESLVPELIYSPEKLEVRCFGRFEIFWKGEPLIFERRQSKELFAYLINLRGASCTSEEIINALWEDETDIKNAKHRVRNLVGDMKNTLQKIGRENILIRKSGLLSVRTELVDCDYYRMLEGDMQAVNSFHGEYMEQYSWAELTKGKLHFMFN